MRWRRVNPVYRVADVAVSIAWYRRMFGWVPGHVNHAPDRPNYAVLVQDRTSILHLLRRDEAPHGLTAPVEAPAGRPWGHRDFVVADPDSNLVWVTTPHASGRG